MSATDPFAERPATLESPARHAAVVTPNDGADLAVFSRSLLIGTGGDLKVTTVSDEVVTLVNVPAGILPLCVRRVWSTGTTASQIASLW